MTVSDPSTTDPSPATIAARTVPSSAREESRWKKWAGRIPGPLVGLVVIFVLLSILSPYFLTPRTLR